MCPPLRVEWTCPNEGAVRVANTSGCAPTEAGTVFPPATPARMSWNVSAAYVREQAGQTCARRLPHGTITTPSGASAEEKDDRTAPVVVSTVSDRPRSRIGWAQLLARAKASENASAEPSIRREVMPFRAVGVRDDRSNPASSPYPGKPDADTGEVPSRVGEGARLGLPVITRPLPASIRPAG